MLFKDFPRYVSLTGEHTKGRGGSGENRKKRKEKRKRRRGGGKSKARIGEIEDKKTHQRFIKRVVQHERGSGVLKL